MRKTNYLLALALILAATVAQARGLENQLTGPNAPLGGYQQRSFEVQGPTGATEMRGQPDGFGGYYLSGPSGQSLGRINGDGTISSPSGGYEGRVNNF